MAEDKTTAAEQEQHVQVRMVCTGKDKGGGGQAVWLLRMVQPDGELGGEKVYRVKTFPTMRAGHVYTVDATTPAATQVYSKTEKWERPWDDTAQRVAWEAQARAFDAGQVAARQRKREETRNMIAETLEPLRAAYRKTNFQNRTALAALVLYYLEHGELPED